MVAAPPPCTAQAARHAIVGAPALRSLRATLANGGGPDRLICHDLTRDGRGDMAVTVFSGGTAGDTAWVVFRRAGNGWKLAGGDLIESQPIYRKNDPNCCPSGGFAQRRFHWNGRTFVVTQRRHSKHFVP